MSITSLVLSFIVLSMLLALFKVIPGAIKALMYFFGTFFILGFLIVTVMYFFNYYFI